VISPLFIELTCGPSTANVSNSLSSVIVLTVMSVRTPGVPIFFQISLSTKHADDRLSRQWRSQGFQSGGLRGRVREGYTPSRWGSGGCAPGKFFKLHMHVGEFWRSFQTEISALTPVFMPVDF
jgi:hypothetical protein